MLGVPSSTGKKAPIIREKIRGQREGQKETTEDAPVKKRKSCQPGKRSALGRNKKENRKETEVILKKKGTPATTGRSTLHKRRWLEGGEIRIAYPKRNCSTSLGKKRDFLKKARLREKGGGKLTWTGGPPPGQIHTGK